MQSSIFSSQWQQESPLPYPPSAIPVHSATCAHSHSFFREVSPCCKFFICVQSARPLLCPFLFHSPLSQVCLYIILHSSYLHTVLSGLCMSLFRFFSFISLYISSTLSLLAPLLWLPSLCPLLKILCSQV